MRLLETSDVLALIKVGRNTLTTMVAGGHFPEPIILGKRKRRWREADVFAWMAAQ